MAICRPGRPSSMNRAATSLIRVAPLVITTNWITTRIANRIAPTTTWSPATNSPKARITPPGRVQAVLAAAGQDQPGGRDVEHQPGQRRRQQDRRKRR